MDCRRKTSALFIIAALTVSIDAAPYFGAFWRTDQVQALIVAERIQDLIFSITETQKFELASAPAFFPIGKDFFELMDYMRLIRVNRNTINELRDYAFAEVRLVQKMIYDHQIKTSEFVEHLASTAFDLKNGDENVEKLVCDLRGIEDSSAALIIDIWGIIMRIENLAEEFTYRVEDAIQDISNTDVSALEVIRERATTLGQAYSEMFGQFSNLMDKVQGNFGFMLPAFGNYIELLKLENKHQIKPTAQ